MYLLGMWLSCIFGTVILSLFAVDSTGIEREGYIFFAAIFGFMAFIGILAFVYYLLLGYVVYTREQRENRDKSTDKGETK